MCCDDTHGKKCTCVFRTKVVTQVSAAGITLASLCVCFLVRFWSLHIRIFQCHETFHSLPPSVHDTHLRSWAIPNGTEVWGTMAKSVDSWTRLPSTGSWLSHLPSLPWSSHLRDEDVDNSFLRDLLWRLNCVCTISVWGVFAYRLNCNLVELSLLWCGKQLFLRLSPVVQPCSALTYHF